MYTPAVAKMKLEAIRQLGEMLDREQEKLDENREFLAGLVRDIQDNCPHPFFEGKTCGICGKEKRRGR
jgi:hypothetical protein